MALSREQGVDRVDMLVRDTTSYYPAPRIRRRGNEAMIRHEAMPRFSRIRVIGEIEQESADLAFRAVVKWLDSDCKHNPVPPNTPNYLKHLKRRECPECWQSLLDAVREGK